MRKLKTLLKPAAVNRTVTSHPAAFALSQLPPQTCKHMNHAELARHRKKADTKTKRGNGGPIPDPTKVERNWGPSNVVSRDTAAPQIPMTLGEGNRLARVVA